MSQLTQERAMLYAAIIYRDDSGDMADAIPDPTVFYRSGHQMLWRAFQTLVRARKRVGWAELLEQCRLNGELTDEVRDCVGEIRDDHAARSADWRSCSEAILNAWQRRELVAVAHRMIANLSRDDADLPASLAWLTSTVESVTALRTSPIPSAHDVAKILDAEIEAAVTTGKVAGWATGHKTLDKRTLGWLPGSLHLLCGRSGDGKTYLAWSLCNAFQWANPDKHAGIVSLEMQPHELASRQVVGDAFFRDAMDSDEATRDHLAYKARQRLAQYLKRPVRVAQPFPIRMDVIERTIKAMAREGVSFVVLDYVQMVPSGARKGEDSFEAIQRQMQTLKAVAVEYGIVIVILSQMNRGTYNRSLMDAGLEDSFGHQGAQASNAAHTVSFPIRVAVHRHTDEKVTKWAAAFAMQDGGEFRTADQIVIHKFAKGRRGVPNHFVFWIDNDGVLEEPTREIQERASNAVQAAFKRTSAD